MSCVLRMDPSSYVNQSKQEVSIFGRLKTAFYFKNKIMTSQCDQGLKYVHIVL